MKFRLLIGALAAATMWGCGEAADEATDALLEEAGAQFTFKGTVTKDGTGAGIEGANIKAVSIGSASAVEEYVEYEDVADGAGATKPFARVSFSKVAAASSEYVAKADASGAFELKAPLGAYVLYVYGPDGFEPDKANGYTAEFRGVNPETGELGFEFLIGSDGKTEQEFALTLSGGPLPPAPPAAPPADPPAQPDPPAAEPTEDPVEPEPPTPENPNPPAPPAEDPNPDRLDPPALDADFWAKTNLAYDGGSIGTDTMAYQVDEAPVAAGSSYLTLTAELTTAQTEPVFLVMQVGFDSQRVVDCDGTDSQPKTVVYPVQPNGTQVAYKLVPPGDFYKVYFAKSASKADGEPVESENNSVMLTVGSRTCDSARPERPFLATLTWDKPGDLDIHVTKYDLATLAAGDVEGALIDTANWLRRNGTSLSLDVDNTQGYGPENNGEAATVENPNDFCYVARVHLYSAPSSSLPITANVDVVHVVTAADDTTADQVLHRNWSASMSERKEWQTVGVFGAEGCQALVNPPAAAE